MKCPHCGENIERELRIKLSTGDGKIRVVATDTFEDPKLERKAVKAVANILVAIGRELGTPMKFGKVKQE